MRNSIIRFVAIFFAVTLALAATSCGGKTQPATNEATSAEAAQTHTPQRPVVAMSDSLLRDRAADTIQMGRIRSGEIVVKELTLRNAGDTPLVITGLEKTCDCLGLTYPRAPLRPGEEGVMELSFDTSRLSGWVYKTIGLRTSLGTRAHILVVMADIEP